MIELLNCRAAQRAVKSLAFLFKLFLKSFTAQVSFKVVSQHRSLWNGGSGRHVHLEFKGDPSVLGHSHDGTHFSCRYGVLPDQGQGQ